MGYFVWFTFLLYSIYHTMMNQNHLESSICYNFPRGLPHFPCLLAPPPPPTIHNYIVAYPLWWSVGFFHRLITETLAENGRITQVNNVIKAFGKIMSAYRGEVSCTVITAKVRRNGIVKRNLTNRDSHSNNILKYLSKYGLICIHKLMSSSRFIINNALKYMF